MFKLSHEVKTTRHAGETDEQIIYLYRSIS